MCAQNVKTSVAKTGTTESSEWDLVIARVFDAPRSLVFRAWTDARHTAQWWGPKGVTNSDRKTGTTESSEWDLVIARVFDAPRSLVFRAWTDARHTAQWWGPKGFTNPVCELDARVGGAIRIHMRAPDGVVY